MAAIVKLPSGSWRAQVRRKGKYVTATFLRRKDADEWAPQPSAISIVVFCRTLPIQKACEL